MATNLAQQILHTLAQREPGAAFVMEVATALRTRVGAPEIEAALAELGQQGKVLLTDRPAPDVHLEGVDLRIVARLPERGDEAAAYAATERVWNEWLRAFLATHRCQ